MYIDTNYQVSRDLGHPNSPNSPNNLSDAKIYSLYKSIVKSLKEEYVSLIPNNPNNPNNPVSNPGSINAQVQQRLKLKIIQSQLNQAYDLAGRPYNPNYPNNTFLR